MSDSKSARKATRHLSWLWFAPVIVVLAMGTLTSVQGSSATKIVSKAKSFQDTNGAEASQSLDEISTRKYNLAIALNDDFSVEGEGYKTSGSYRKNQIIEIPVDYAGEKGFTITSSRMELVGERESPLISGLKLLVRSCDTPWVKSRDGLTCNGPSLIRVPGTPLTGDTFAVQKSGEELKEGQVSHLMVEISRTPELIVPLGGGYKTPMEIRFTGVKASEK